MCKSSKTLFPHACHHNDIPPALSLGLPVQASLRDCGSCTTGQAPGLYVSMGHHSALHLPLLCPGSISYAAHPHEMPQTLTWVLSYFSPSQSLYRETHSRCSKMLIEKMRENKWMCHSRNPTLAPSAVLSTEATSEPRLEHRLPWGQAESGLRDSLRPLLRGYLRATSKPFSARAGRRGRGKEDRRGRGAWNQPWPCICPQLFYKL